MQSQYGSNFEGRTISISQEQAVSMSKFVSRTYGWMFVGLLITSAISFLVASSESMLTTLAENRWMLYGALIGELVLVLGLSAAINRISAATATFGFLAYSALNGVTMSLILLAYTATSVGQVFLITAGMFGGLALYGTVTKKDLTGIGSFVGMGLWGLILVGLVNMFVRSEALNLGLSVAGVVIFAGLTAYDAQRIRMLAYHATNQGTSEASDKGAIIGALMLYLDFINLFLNLLRLFGNRRD
jgi:FtsH-binding integral membrane protein